MIGSKVGPDTKTDGSTDRRPQFNLTSSSHDVLFGSVNPFTLPQSKLPQDVSLQVSIRELPFEYFQGYPLYRQAVSVVFLSLSRQTTT
jgi:hypothetical protein